jgi:N-acetylglucosaminyldiphosphoundecaprenol N-acetyl-beta-D-mannosaminyltransferase
MNIITAITADRDSRNCRALPCGMLRDLQFAWQLSHRRMLCRHVLNIARSHRHRCVALMRSCRCVRRGKIFLDIEFDCVPLVPIEAPVAKAIQVQTVLLGPLDHIVIRKSTCRTHRRRNLTVDGIAINVSSLPQAVSSIVAAAQHGDNFCICTLNLDHVVKLQQQSAFRAAYLRARFVTADGFPIVILSRLLGTRIRRTTGADLVEPVCRQARRKQLPIFMIGSNDHTLAIAAKRLSERFRGLEIADYYAPSANFDPYSSEADAAIDRIRASGAKLCFVALGAPRQELFAARCLDELNGTGLLCIGAALDFIAGTQIRAPSLTQTIGLEWAWRMLREPRRLGPRYARCMAIIPRLVVCTIPQIFNARMRKAA